MSVELTELDFNVHAVSAYYSSYPETYILQELTSREVIIALTDIFARFGFPEEMVSDNGKQFFGGEFKAFLK